MERPLATLGFSFFLSLMLASFLDLKMTIVLAALCFFAFLTGICVRSLRKNKRIMTVLLAAVAAFSMYTGQEVLTYRPLQKWDGQTASLKLETLDYVQKTAYSHYVTTQVLDGDLPKGTKVTLWVDGKDLYPSPYDRLEGTFDLQTPSDSRDGLIRGYSKAQGAFLSAYSSEFDESKIVLTESESRPWMYKILELRRYIELLVLSQPGMQDVGGLMSGIAFGFKDQISGNIQDNFRSVGVTHLLAVSGMQTALLAQALLALLKLLHVPRRLTSFLTAAGVVFFMALTGFTPSVMRAGLMSILFVLGLLFGREPDSLNSLGFAVLAITIFNPYAVNDAGLLLSFAATFGLLVLEAPLQRITADRLKVHTGWTRFLAKPVEALDVTIAATIPTLPVILFTFGQISLVSPISNLLMVFPSTVVTLAVCLGVLFASIPFLHILGTLVFWVGQWVTRYLIWIAAFLASFPSSSIRVQQLFVMVWIPGTFLLVCLGWKIFRRKGVRLAALCSLISLLCGLLSYNITMRNVTTITVLQAGDASAVLLERNGRNGLVVLGSDSAVTSAQRSLKRWSIRKLDFLMIPDGSSKSAFCSMIITENIDVDCLVTGHKAKYSDTLEELKISGDRLYWDDGDIGFWNDCKASLIDGGWLQLQVSKTRLLLCPPGGNAASLTEGQRQTNAAVFTALPPSNITAITAQAGVLSCKRKSLPAVVKALPQGLYPVKNTSRNEVTLLTRGQGDLTYDGRNTIADYGK